MRLAALGSRKIPLTLHLLLFALICSPIAQAWDFTAFGGLNYAAPTQRISGNDIRWTGDAGFSYGFTVALPIFSLPFEAETGFFMIQENSSREESGLPIVRKNRMLQFPLVVRFKFDEHIGIGIGGYYATGQGQVEQTLGTSVTEVSYATAGQKTHDAGLIANVRARFNLAPPLFFILDARYQHGLSLRAAADTDLHHTRSIQALAGFQYVWNPSDSDTSGEWP